jgi:hypothetical protein
VCRLRDTPAGCSTTVSMTSRTIFAASDCPSSPIVSCSRSTVNDDDSGFDYDEFSCVPIADPELESIARRACQAFEQGLGREPILESLLKETEVLAKKG